MNDWFEISENMTIKEFTTNILYNTFEIKDKNNKIKIWTIVALEIQNDNLYVEVEREDGFCSCCDNTSYDTLNINEIELKKYIEPPKLPLKPMFEKIPQCATCLKSNTMNPYELTFENENQTSFCVECAKSLSQWIEPSKEEWKTLKTIEKNKRIEYYQEKINNLKNKM